VDLYIHSSIHLHRENVTLHLPGDTEKYHEEHTEQVVLRRRLGLVCGRCSVRNSAETPTILIDVFFIFLSPFRRMPGYDSCFPNLFQLLRQH
jgi:hypothetical protein